MRQEKILVFYMALCLVIALCTGCDMRDDYEIIYAPEEKIYTTK